MTHDISIDSKKLNRLRYCEIEKSAEALSDTAVLSVHAMTHGRALQVEEQIRAEMPISISLGYDDKNEKEFEGYVASTSIENGTLRIRCEDAMYLLRKDVKNVQLSQVSATEVAEQVLTEVAPSLELVAGEGLSDIRFDEFNIVDATAWDVLKKLKEQAGITAYVRGKKLYLSLRYLQDSSSQQEVLYNFERNVEKSHLKYVRAEERKVLVKVIGIGKDNRRYEATAGQARDRTALPFLATILLIQRHLRRSQKRSLRNGATQDTKARLTSWLAALCHLRNEGKACG